MLYAVCQYYCRVSACVSVLLRSRYLLLSVAIVLWGCIMYAGIVSKIISCVFYLLFHLDTGA